MITLASDFGSPYPAAMKAVVLRRCDARLVDVAHDLPRGDIRQAAFWLRFVLPEFPQAVHLVVVDPGVGTDRAALVLQAGEHVLVGPDNGVLLPAARALAGEEPIQAFEIRVDEPASATFHGRDVFAPAAADAHRAGAEDLATVGRFHPTEDLVDLELPAAELRGGGATGEVLAVDGFGNVITNIPGRVLDGADAVRVNGAEVPVERTFGAVGPGERLVTVGSHGNVECDVNDGRGDQAFDLGPGDDVQLEW